MVNSFLYEHEARAHVEELHAVADRIRLVHRLRRARVVEPPAPWRRALGLRLVRLGAALAGEPAGAPLVLTAR